jgi:hypothetical protein
MGPPAAQHSYSWATYSQWRSDSAQRGMAFRGRWQMRNVMRKTILVLAILIISLLSWVPARADHALASLLVGQCSQTTISAIGYRLTDSPSSGSSVGFTNGGAQVSYRSDNAVENSSVGDKAIMCLVELPKDCPVGDQRGRVYLTVNQRLNRFWVIADSSHTCGGA